MRRKIRCQQWNGRSKRELLKPRSNKNEGSNANHRTDGSTSSIMQYLFRYVHVCNTSTNQQSEPRAIHINYCCLQTRSAAASFLYARTHSIPFILMVHGRLSRSFIWYLGRTAKIYPVLRIHYGKEPECIEHFGKEPECIDKNVSWGWGFERV